MTEESPVIEKIPPLSEEDGDLSEWTTHDAARLTMAYWILAGVAVILIGGGVVYLLAPDNRKEQAQAIWDFAKGFGPPLVTLVIGFYFRASQE